MPCINFFIIIKNMRILSILFIASFLFSCNQNKNAVKENRIQKTQFQSIIDSNNVKGSILIYDLKKDTYYSNDFKWSKVGRLPASTYKIPNSIIALETNIVENDSTLFKWNGEKRAYKSWEQDLILKNAFHYSCVPCYQEIARKIGEKRMNTYLTKLKYMDMKVDAKNIDLFWLEGKSIINQFQQIDFLKRFYKSELKISKRTEEIMKKMMIVQEKENYKLSGKTGLSVRNGNYNGWFVGYLESKETTYIFATNVSPKEKTDIKLFPKLRKKITLKALEILKK